MGNFFFFVNVFSSVISFDHENECNKTSEMTQKKNNFDI